MQSNLPYGVNDLDIIRRLYRKQNKINKSYRVTYQSKDGKKDFIGAADKTEVDEKIKELKYHDHKILDVDLLKAKVYIKNPSEAPQGVKVEEGPAGGHYYESDQISNTKPEIMRPFSSVYPKPAIDWYKQKIINGTGNELFNRDNNERFFVLYNTDDINIINFFINDPNPDIKLNAVQRCDMSHLHKSLNDENSIIREEVANRIDQNGLHIMMHNNDSNIGIRHRIVNRIDLAGLEHILSKWETGTETYDIAQKRYFYVKLVNPIIEEFNKTGTFNLNDELKNYIINTMEKDVNSEVVIKATDEFYNMINNGKYSKFHLDSRSDWEASSSSTYALLLKDSVKRQFGGEIRYHDSIDNIEQQLQELYTKYPQELVDNYVKIQKQLTKTFLDVMFPNTNEITIYRGTSQKEIENIKNDSIKTCLVKSNSLSSWTLKNTIAENFAKFYSPFKQSVVLKTQISKDDIWSTFLSHAYQGNEREILVIGKDHIANFYTKDDNL